MKLSQTTCSCPEIWNRTNSTVSTEACMWTGLSQVTIHLSAPEACGASICWEARPQHPSPACPMLSFLWSEVFPQSLRSTSHCAPGCSAHNRGGSDIKLWAYKLNRSNFKAGYYLAKHYHAWACCNGGCNSSLCVPDATVLCDCSSSLCVPDATILCVMLHECKLSYPWCSVVCPHYCSKACFQPTKLNACLRNKWSFNHFNFKSYMPLDS